MASVIATSLEQIREFGGLRGSDVANILDVSQATVSRWSTGKASPHPGDERLLSDLRYIVDRLAEFYSPEETRAWLYSRHKLLDDSRAIDLIHDGKVESVLAVIRSLDEGAYT